MTGRLDVDEVRRALARIRDCTAGVALFDAHVHPDDVVFPSTDHRPLPDHPGVWAARGVPYAAPSLGSTTDEPAAPPPLSPDDRRRWLLLSARRLYAHVGPTAFGDRLALAGIDRCLLLPVAAAGSTTDTATPALAALYGDDPRFVVGCCVPPGQAPEEVDVWIGDAQANHGAVAIKLHPAISGIDVTTDAGRDHVDAVLEASRRHRLPLVVHAGPSGALDGDAARFGELERLATVDWGRTDQAVVLAHAGAFDRPAHALDDEVFPLLDTMLSRHPTLHVDLSGLGVAAIAAVLGRVDLARVLFGSDALYHPSWTALVRVLRALEVTGRPAGAALRTIAGETPHRLFGGASDP